MKVPVPMHSYDRTLLSSLGFADADKQDRRHGLACRYLALPENRAVLLELSRASEHGLVRIEMPIVKGDGQYRSVVGFVDLAIPARLTTDDKWIFGHVAVEVKINPVDVLDIIRQINLYRTFLGCSRWAVATAFRMTAGDVAALGAEQIRHVWLGKKFAAWAEAQAADDLPSTLSVEL